MLALIFLIIFGLSFFGLLLMIVKKWPELKAASVLTEADQRPFIQRAGERIKNLRPIKNFSSEKLLKRFFTRLKVLLLKSERKVDKYLHQVSHSQKFEEDYWEKVKKEE